MKGYANTVVVVVVNLRLKTDFSRAWAINMVNICPFVHLLFSIYSLSQG